MSALLWWCDFTYTICRVTLPTERVSWNEAYYCVDYNCCVTLPTERVSWNSVLTFILLQSVVTLPTERVSWNHSIVLYGFKAVTSRSPRSVWVEIRLNVYSLLRFSRHAPHGACELKFSYRRKKSADIFVTLPTERVSWNLYTTTGLSVVLSSRSPRSVWVEIFAVFFYCFRCRVTLPTERVSWNFQSPWY